LAGQAKEMTAHTKNSIRRFSPQWKNVTFGSLCWDRFGFVFLNVADFKGILAG
jgi:hypothetical protein